MEKVARRTGKQAGGRWEIPFGACAAVALAACFASPALHAQQAGQQAQAMVVAQARVDQPIRLEVQTSSLPRLDAQESGFSAPRVDLSLFPATTPHFGAVVGMTGFSPTQAQTQAQPLGLQPGRQSVDVGLRFSQRVQAGQVDVTAWRRMGTGGEAAALAQMRQPVYGARVEMNLRPSHRAGPLFVEGGYIGVQLEGDSNIAIKRNNGAPMLYYRTSF